MLGEAIGPREEFHSDVQLNCYLLNMYIYTHRCLLLSAFIKEASRSKELT